MKHLFSNVLRMVFIITVISSFVFTGSANATDGYFANGQGTQNKGFAGAGVAFLNSPFSAAVNPAGIGFYQPADKKWGFEISLEVFNPNRQYTVTGAPTPPQNWGYFDNSGAFVADPRFMALGLAEGTVESDTKYMVIPSLAFTYKLNETGTFGFNLYGNGGMNTDYDTKTYQSAIINSFGNPMPDGNPNPMANVTQPTGVNLMQMFIAATYTHTFAGKHSLGISPIFAYQAFEAKGLEAFRDMGMAGMPGMPVNRMDKVTGNGNSTSTGFGARIGYQGELIEGLKVGLTYQTKMAMSEFEDYAGLFAEEGKFDIPSNWTAGVAYSVNDDFTVMADVKQIMYSDAKSVNNPMDPMAMMPMVPNMAWDGMNPATSMVPNPNFVALGDENGAGFGWEDIMVYKVGVEYAGLKNYVLRAGYSYGEQPIPESEVMFNILAPGVIENHISVGFTRLLNGKEIHVAIVRALSSKVEGTNPFDPAQTIELEMDQWELDFGFSF